ncbi:HAD family phosphatase [Leucobacter allii]|uniref:HAD family hydrolase n=1 Tax=Leucobacter allii TaxID=2932247 RepID=UPI001FD51EC3|nr:HAD family phosphatase [Leucobacter allii]UOR02283.1 HAD family phosphatase [Leucobacter allii]
MARPAPFAGVLFDCDGVLVDSEAITNGVLREMLHELGWPISEEECIARFIGKALRDEWAVILERTGVRIDDAWIGAFRTRRDAALRERIAPIPGVGDALAAVAGRFGERIACASGADRGKIEMQLGLTGLAHWFAGRILSGMEQPRSKPAPDVYLAAAERLGIDAAEALVVEDTVAGVTAGVAAGATVFGYSSGSPTSTPAAELVAAGASRVFTDMAQLPGLVDGGRPVRDPA